MTKSISLPPKKTRKRSKKTKEEECCAEAREENAPSHPTSDFQTARFIRFSLRRPHKITGEEDCSVSITLFQNDRIKTDFIEKIGANQTDFQKITRDDGDVIYHALGDRGDQGTFYMTTLINHENDWDMTLMLSREPGVDEFKLPFAIARDGIKLIGEFESVLRKPKAQPDGGGQPATRPESKCPF